MDLEVYYISEKLKTLLNIPSPPLEIQKMLFLLWKMNLIP